MCALIISAPKDLDKLEGLILCLTESASDIGITKLEKLLYLCDFEAIKELGKSITGDKYKNFQWGPVPKHFIPAYEGLLKEGKLQKREIKLQSGRDFTELTPRESCKPETFSKQE